MSWDYANTINSLALSDIATFSTIESFAPGVFSDPGVPIPGRDGIRFDADSSLSPLAASLRVHLRWTNSSGVVTHADGEDGHIYENLSLLKTELGKPLPLFTRTLPDAGDVEAYFKAVSPGFVGQYRNVYHFPIIIPSGSWRDQTQSDSGTASTTPSVTTLGDRRIHDPIIQFNAAGTLTHTEDDGDAVTVAVASGPTFPVNVYIAGTDGSSDLYAEDAGAADVTGDVSTSKAYGLRFAANSSLTLSSTAAVIVKWRNRYA